METGRTAEASVHVSSGRLTAPGSAPAQAGSATAALRSSAVLQPLQGDVPWTVFGTPEAIVLHSSSVLHYTSSGILVGETGGGEVGAPGPAPLTVAHVGPCLFRGGAEQQLIDLARFLDPRRAVLTKCLVTEQAGIDPAVARDLSCPVVAGGVHEITQAFQDHDIVLCWGLALDQWVDHSAPRRAAGIHIAHGDSPWTRELLTGSRQAVDHAVAVSRRVRDTTCADVPTTVILNGVDTARLATTRSRADIRAELGFGADDFVVGFVGRFSPEKRPELLLRGLHRLPPRFKGLFVGWGPLQSGLLEEANRLVPGRCAFRFADRYLGDFYQAFDAFTLLSVQEGFALVFLEAMFCGLPVVATPVGAVPEVIEHRVNGVIVDGTPEAVASELRLLEGNGPWARGLGESARNYARQHGHARRMADEYAALFERLVAARRAAPCSA
jgi:glycosyltransferase involved in cell wall biosynthesis